MVRQCLQLQFARGTVAQVRANARSRTRENGTGTIVTCAVSLSLCLSLSLSLSLPQEADLDSSAHRAPQVVVLSCWWISPSTGRVVLLHLAPLAATAFSAQRPPW